jgi:glycosyltransferase involved in cell wall biosynthesis
MKEKNPVFSVVVPMFNEQETVKELYKRLSEVMDNTKEDWELILVNDGSADETVERIKEVHSEDKRVRLVNFARNFGQQAAVKAGLDYSKGQAVIVIDADLQDPPEVIHDLIVKWRKGYEVVYAQRTKRVGESKFKLWTAKLFYRIINKITDIDLPLDTGFFRLIDRKVVKVINQMPEKHRFFRALSIWVGFKQIAVPYEREERFAGDSQYPLKKMIKLAVTAITGYSFWPLQMATYLGFIASGLSLLAIPVIAISRLTGSEEFLGQATTLIAVLFLGGVQLIFLGVIGEYIGRMYDEVRGRPLYIVREEDLDQE